MILLFLFCTTKIGEISDIAKCFENFVSQTLGFLTSFYAAELRRYTNISDEGECAIGILTDKSKHKIEKLTPFSRNICGQNHVNTRFHRQSTFRKT